ncbi:TRAP transporter substrate-binding protein [Faecalicatena orotica]|uniref:Tripartite ATP-independent transporter DctP family solute receptor n=1 Tax=Faecalicatena orotica TaxID=1544 RepID=A0A2Y9BPE5_9FIRM|nr:TRAP transporter substrate-binding protein DctP [Faecalicatena orotica]PWJ16882.1 tripartite ATP-independent transporter DctP family solute receptor [Faecalicatena orotica]SSA58840.1 tripartite ATP-independent transporter solute receptor, DctP family [Faecalicatena orotica]
MGSLKKKIGIAVSAIGLAAVVITFGMVLSENSTDKINIRMAHNQADGSEIADSIAKFSEFVAEDASKNLEIDIYPSGVLGSEKEEIEMVQAGILDMAKVSSNTLGQFEDKYSIFAVPYLFTSQEHYYEAMEKSEAVQELFRSTANEGYIAIGYYANGSRNFYLKENKAVTDPSVLKSKKIRSMPSSTSMEMIKYMGGSAVPMAGSETYSALQQGVVDGAENTELVLTVDGHQDIVKSYTYTEHQYSPDIYIISTKKWNSLSAEQQEYLVKCLGETNDNFKTMYNRMMDEAIAEAEEHGVTIYRDIDKTAFIEAVSPIHDEFCEKGDDYKALYDDIEQYAE